MLKLFLKLAHAARRLYWWVVRPVTRGVRAIVVDTEGKVILVRHRYEDGWRLPGGRVRRNEGDKNALERELREELGLDGVSDAKRLGEFQSTYEHKRDTVVVFVVGLFLQKPTCHFEIEDWYFFDPNALPSDVSRGTRRRIEEWLGQKQIDSRW